MQTELFQGTPQDLKKRVDEIILSDTPTDLKVVTLGEKSWYMIIWS